MSGVPGPAHENGEDSDSPTLSDEEIEKALQIAFEARDPRDVRKDSEAMIALRGRFEEIAARPGDKTLTQAKAIALLRAMSESLKPATQISRGLATEGHPAIELLDELIDALADLQRRTPPAGRRRSHCSSRIRVVLQVTIGVVERDFKALHFFSVRIQAKENRVD